MEITTLALALIIIGGVIYWALSGGKSNTSPEDEEERKRIIIEKYNSIERSAMLSMTIEEIASATGSTVRFVASRMCRDQIKCKDFDGSLSPEERETSRAIEKKIGILAPKVICPHCQTKGQVHKKMGVKRYENTTDTTNLTAAILSGKKTSAREVTQLHCTNCETAWDI